MAVSSGERVEAREVAEPEAPRAGTAAAGMPAASPIAIARGLAGADLATRARLMRSLQQTHGNRAVAQIARTVTYDECSSGQETKILKAHKRAWKMLKNAISELDDYDGTDPAAVHTALQKNFNSTSTTVAWIVQNNFEALESEMDWSFDPQYECQAEQDGTTLAWVPWCVPGADIEVYPRFFNKKDGSVRPLNEQASTLIHEWFHKYRCKLDVGYAHEKEYADASTLRQLANADSFAEFAEQVW